MMTFDPKSHRRRSLRLQGYDYSQSGAYFVTLCTHDRECLFGTVGKSIDSTILQMNDGGTAATNCWLEIPKHFPFVELDSFIVMPNHVHGILLLVTHDPSPAQGTRANDDSPLQRGTSETIGSIVRGFKIGVTKWFRENRAGIDKVWQRNYYEHVIRNEQELNVARQYIADNPVRAKDHSAM